MAKKAQKKVKMYIISIARRAVRELSETNIILQDCYYGHLAHFQYTSFWKLKKNFFHSTLMWSSKNVHRYKNIDTLKLVFVFRMFSHVFSEYI